MPDTSTESSHINLQFRRESWIGQLGNGAPITLTSDFDYESLEEGDLSESAKTLAKVLFYKFKDIHTVQIEPSNGRVFVRIVAAGDATVAYMGVNMTMSQFELALMPMPPHTEDQDPETVAGLMYMRDRVMDHATAQQLFGTFPESISYNELVGDDDAEYLVPLDDEDEEVDLSTDNDEIEPSRQSPRPALKAASGGVPVQKHSPTSPD